MNLFTWKEYNRTYYFFLFVLIVYIALKAMPIRYMMLAGSNEYENKMILKLLTNGLMES